jgi:hypothetical protein
LCEILGVRYQIPRPGRKIRIYPYKSLAIPGVGLWGLNNKKSLRSLCVCFSSVSSVVKNLGGMGFRLDLKINFSSIKSFFEMIIYKKQETNLNIIKLRFFH